jgi:hypothetical protein
VVPVEAGATLKGVLYVPFVRSLSRSVPVENAGEDHKATSLFLNGRRGSQSNEINKSAAIRTTEVAPIIHKPVPKHPISIVVMIVPETATKAMAERDEC